MQAHGVTRFFGEILGYLVHYLLITITGKTLRGSVEVLGKRLEQGTLVNNGKGRTAAEEEVRKWALGNSWKKCNCSRLSLSSSGSIPSLERDVVCGGNTGSQLQPPTRGTL